MLNHQREFVRRALNSGKQLSAVIDDVLDTTRLDVNRVPLRSQTARLGQVFGLALEAIEPQAAMKHVKILNHVSGGTAEMPFVGDESRVHQIISNLLSNAVKFTASGGHVIVSRGSAERGTSAHIQGPWVYVRIEDNGVGIPADKLERIFEPFEQARSGDITRGLGLGMSISRRLARLIGGDLSVRSEVGCGSEFVLWLPIAATVDVPR